MHSKQHTIKKSITVSGVGLHTGVKSNMTFVPAQINHGLKFQRIDLPDQPIIPADVDFVVDLSRGTSIGWDNVRVNTIEHTLAALVGLQIDNVLIQLDGPEPPIMDGSSDAFVKALLDAEIEEQNAFRKYFEVTENIIYKDEDRNVEIAALPLSDYRLTVMVDYNSQVLGPQHASLTNIDNFTKDISSSRTFVFLHEIESLFKQNLIKGGDLDNAIVIADRVINDDELDHLAKLLNKSKIKLDKAGVLNNVELRHINEPARHKLLDLIGDLALVGRPLKAQIMAARPGHAANVAFAKKIKKMMIESEKNYVPKYDPSVPPLLDAVQISNILPHRYPFQLVDKITYLDETTVVGIKNVTMNETFFQGHFPGNPVMPGVLMVEAMAQTGGIFLLNTVQDPQNYWTYFLGIDECRFKKMVIPGDTLVFHCEILAPVKRGIAKMRGKAFVAGKLVLEAVLTASIVKKS
jgi:UDP-3-O-[3-hydroxymyristoyl] N-acetylglucosamine deacetylase / 3-hydroxyacyl-[acyl-carrier-protein] dehydratase